MPKERITKRVTRKGKVSASEAARLKKLREQAKTDFPPSPKLEFPDVGVGAMLRKAREKQGLTWYAVAKAAGIPHASTVRDIELGKDAKLSTVTAVAKALNLAVKLHKVA